MPAFNREDALRAADQALRANKIEQAIAEYARILEHQPRDFNTANNLGDLYARVGQTDNAIGQYARLAEQFLTDGFLPKASALFKKILKIRPEDEHAILRLGQIAAKLGLLADARAFLTTVSTKRRARGDVAGADDVLIELADLDPENLEGRMQAARILAARGDGDAAAARLRNTAIELLEKGRPQEAVDVLREAVHLIPDDRLTRKQLIGLLTDLEQAEEAEVYLTRDVAGDDPAMLLALAKAELETGRLEEGREDMKRALALAPAGADVMAFVKRVAPRQPDAAYAAADALIENAVARREPAQAVDAIRGFLACVPSHVPAAMRFVELCLEEGLDDALAEAQHALADAYVASGQPEAAARIREEMADPLAEGKAGAGAPETDVEIPQFDVYVYGQPIEPEQEPRNQRTEPREPAEPAESEEQLIARLLAEEAAQDAPAVPQVAPEIDLTDTLDALDQPAAEAAPAPEAVADGARERARAGAHERAEAAFEEAELAGALGQIADAERLYAEAAASAPFRFRSAAALGRLLDQEGRLVEAIEWFERATEVPAPDRDAGHALLYALGDALERHGESMRALAIFMELNAEAGDYRGVSARVERLARAEIGG